MYIVIYIEKIYNHKPLKLLDYCTVLIGYCIVTYCLM